MVSNDGTDRIQTVPASSFTHSLTLPLILTVFEPNLEFRLIGSPTSADFVEGAPKHQTE